MGTVKTDKMVRMLCKQTGGLRNYNNFLDFLLLGLKDLNLYALPMFRIKEVQVNSYNAINWPSDCVYPLAIGLERNGRIAALDIDPRIVVQKGLSSTKNIVEYQQEVEMFFDGREDFSPLSIGSDSLGEWYGADLDYNRLGYVNHDKKSRQSQLVGTIGYGDCVIMYYKSDGLEECPDEVPSETELPLRYFMLHHHELIARPTVAEVHLKNYKREFIKLRKFYQNTGESSWIDAFRSNDKTSPR